MNLCKRPSCLLPLIALLTGLALAPPAAADNCAADSGYRIGFFGLPGDSPAIPDDLCSDKFRCAKPEALGPFVQKVSATCDPEAGACVVRAHFPWEFRGNEENIDDVGLGGAPTPVIYWFDGPADPECKPWLETECGQVGICGLSFFKINTDFSQTWLQLGEASCEDPVPTQHSGLLSVLAASCPSRFSCPKREFDQLDVTPTKVKKALGCVDPPKQDCEESCTACALPVGGFQEPRDSGG